MTEPKTTKATTPAKEAATPTPEEIAAADKLLIDALPVHVGDTVKLAEPGLVGPELLTAYGDGEPESVSTTEWRGVITDVINTSDEGFVAGFEGQSIRFTAASLVTVDPEEPAVSEETAVEPLSVDDEGWNPIPDFADLPNGTDAAYWGPAAKAAKAAIENAGGGVTYAQVLIAVVYDALSVEDHEALDDALELVGKVIEKWQDNIGTNLLNA